MSKSNWLKEQIKVDEYAWSLLDSSGCRSISVSSECVEEWGLDGWRRLAFYLQEAHAQCLINDSIWQNFHQIFLPSPRKFGMKRVSLAENLRASLNIESISRVLGYRRYLVIARARLLALISQPWLRSRWETVETWARSTWRWWFDKKVSCRRRLSLLDTLAHIMICRIERRRTSNTWRKNNNLSITRVACGF